MKYYTPIFEPNNYYHIYNHAVGKDILFKNEDNYNFFLDKYLKYIFPISDTYAYCLMPNHFHFAIKIKDEIKIETVMRTFPKFKTLEKLTSSDIEKFISKQFSNLFSSYTQSFNKQQNRKGNLFQKPFKRMLISNNKQLKNTIYYIHNNPLNHKFTNNIQNWKYSSYKSLLSNKKTYLKRHEVTELFENKENFIFVHNKNIDININFE